MSDLIKWLDFPALGDDRGSLVALESSETIPFDIKRVYYIFGNRKNVSRGFHAHRNLKQVMLCITGSCQIILDDGESRDSVWLNSPVRGLLVEDLVWREMRNFSPDCVLLVIASEHYNESDYIRDYNEFKKLSCL
jgi:dTDP-4-dehydrorhamnose 3,5-epimerase-like enzyme